MSGLWCEIRSRFPWACEIIIQLFCNILIEHMSNKSQAIRLQLRGRQGKSASHVRACIGAPMEGSMLRAAAAPRKPKHSIFKAPNLRRRNPRPQRTSHEPTPKILAEKSQTEIPHATRLSATSTTVLASRPKKPLDVFGNQVPMTVAFPQRRHRPKRGAPEAYRARSISRT